MSDEHNDTSTVIMECDGDKRVMFSTFDARSLTQLLVDAGAFAGRQGHRDIRIISVQVAGVPVLTSEQEALLAQSGVDTPGCDCDHDGMGAKWHLTRCRWMRQVRS